MTLLRLALVSLVAGALGCSHDPERCPRVAGEFQPVYAPLVTAPAPGTVLCAQAPEPVSVAIDDTPKPVQTSIVTLANGRLTTEVVRRGCTVEMTQLYESPGPGQPQSFLSATDLVVENENEMAGPVSMTRYDVNGNVTCWSAYQMRLLKQSATLGAAVGSAVGAVGGTGGR